MFPYFCILMPYTLIKRKIFVLCHKDLYHSDKSLSFRKDKLYEVVRKDTLINGSKMQLFKGEVTLLNEDNQRHSVFIDKGKYEKGDSKFLGWLEYFTFSRRVLIEKTGFYL